MKIEDLKEAVSELMNELYAGMGPDDEDISLAAMHKGDEERALAPKGVSSKASAKEKKLLKLLTKLAYNNQIGNKTLEQMVQAPTYQKPVRPQWEAL